jgi:hypothetical protein
MTVFAGDVINASDINGIINLLPVTYSKASALDRTSTTTYADDNELAGIALSVGTYTIELVGMFTLTTTATQKIKTNWAFSGTWNNPVRACIGPGSAQTASRTDVTETQLGGYTATGQDAVYDTAAGGGFSTFREIGAVVSVSVAGNLSLQWAQSVSSANATSLKAGTSFIVRKIS